MQHIIKKQIINLALNKKADAFRMQQTVSGHYRQEIVPLIESVFNDLSKTEETMHIDQLEIDLGILSEQEFYQARWSENILLKIRSQLIKQIGKQPGENTINREAEALSICRQWLFYMQKGYLPWNVLRINDAWFEKVLETLAVDFDSVSELRRMIRHNAAVGRRIILQHDEAFLVKLIEILTAEKQYDLAKWVQQLSVWLVWVNKEHVAETNRKAAKQKIWEQLIQVAAGSEKKLSPQRLAEIFLEQHKTGEALVEDILVKHASELTLILPVIEKLLEHKAFSKEPEEPKDTVLTDVKEEIDAVNDRAAIDEAGVFVQNAGIVLVHPFLPALYKRLKWVTEGKFGDKQLQQKALCLLHYLATGNATAGEHELVIAKILCNWPLAMPVEKDMKLSQDELSEADHMLQAVIEQWELLKNTSPDGLREGFLQRRGKVFNQNDKRYLQVESSSLDVLLDQLPWNLNMIKLPWMKEILWVEWR